MPKKSPKIPQQKSCDFAVFVMIWYQLEKKSFPQHQRIIAQFLEQAYHNGTEKLLLMAFRSSGKSTMVGLFAAWLLYRNPNKRIMVVAAEQALATKMVRNVKALFEKHPLLMPLKPEKLQQWASDEFTIKRSETLRDPSMVARGLFGNITGFRADIIICDDVEVPNNCDTADKREILRHRLSEIDFVLVPQGMQLFVGTPHTHDSIYKYYEDHTKIGYLQEFHRLIMPILNDQGQSNWQERYDLAAIENLKKRHGLAKFQSQMMLESVPIKSSLFNPQFINFYDSEIQYHLANNTQIFQLNGKNLLSASCYWDPAFGLSEGNQSKGDASVVACVFSDADNNYYIHDCEYITINANQSHIAAQIQCQKIAQFLNKNYIPAIMVETNGLGKFLPSLLRKEIHHAGINAAVIEKNQTSNKNSRIISAWDAPLNAGAIFAHRRVAQTPLLQELRDFQAHKTNNKDDGLDAISSCILQEPIRLNTRPPLMRRPVVGNMGRVFQAH